MGTDVAKRGGRPPIGEKKIVKPHIMDIFDMVEAFVSQESTVQVFPGEEFQSQRTLHIGHLLNPKPMDQNSAGRRIVDGPGGIGQLFHRTHPANLRDSEPE